MAAIYGLTHYQTEGGGRKAKAGSCGNAAIHYNKNVNCLTSQERKVLIIVMLLLAIGELVKVYRAGHPPVTTIQQSPA